MRVTTCSEQRERECPGVTDTYKTLWNRLSSAYNWKPRIDSSPQTARFQYSYHKPRRSRGDTTSGLACQITFVKYPDSELTKSCPILLSSHDCLLVPVLRRRGFSLLSRAAADLGTRTQGSLAISVDPVQSIEVSEPALKLRFCNPSP